MDNKQYVRDLAMKLHGRCAVMTGWMEWENHMKQKLLRMYF